MVMVNIMDHVFWLNFSNEAEKVPGLTTVQLIIAKVKKTKSSDILKRFTSLPLFKALSVEQMSLQKNASTIKAILG